MWVEYDTEKNSTWKEKNIWELQINLILSFHENSLSHIQRQIITFISDSSNNFCMHKGWSILTKNSISIFW